MNRADLSARAGRYQQQATRRKGPAVAGLEAAGEVVAVGQSVGLFACGDRVMGQCSGGFAELVAVDERILMPAPTSLGWLEAAATPVALVTGHDAIATGAGLVAGDSVLIQGAGSTVGMIAVQVARLLGAGLVLGTTGDRARADLLATLGADVVVDRSDQGELIRTVARETAERGADVVMDHFGGTDLGANLEASRRWTDGQRRPPRVQAGPARSRPSGA